MIAKFEWADPKKLSDALPLLERGAIVKAGGVDVLDRLKEGLDSPQRLVNIRNIAELGGIAEEANGLRIGPLATLAQIESHPVVRAKYRALADAAGHAATPNIRNMATVGGNLLQRPRCWYFRNAEFHCLKKGGSRCFAQNGENEYHAIFNNRTCAIVHPSAAGVALVALDASIEITGAKGKREVRLEEFFVRPERDVTRENSLGLGELVTAIRIPAPKLGSTSAYMKLGEKESFDWPIAEVAVRLDRKGATVEKASIILGAADPVPHRATDAEAALAGKAADEQTARAAAVAALRGATPLANNQYKLPVFEAVVRRTILAAAGSRSA